MRAGRPVPPFPSSSRGAAAYGRERARRPGCAGYNSAHPLSCDFAADRIERVHQEALDVRALAHDLIGDAANFLELTRLERHQAAQIIELSLCVGSFGLSLARQRFAFAREFARELSERALKGADLGVGGRDLLCLP